MLTDDAEVPHGHYAEETMAVTVVPNRNAIMLSVACGMAVARGIHNQTLQTCPALAAVLDLFEHVIAFVGCVLPQGLDLLG